MKKRQYIALLLAAAIAGSAAWALWSVGIREATTDANPGASSPVPRQLNATALPARRTFTRRIPLIGVVETQAAVTLTALTAGRVETIDAKDQTRLEKGRRVMQLGGPQVAAARAGLAAAIESLTAQVALARQSVARTQENLRTQLATRDQVAGAQEAQLRLEAQLAEARLHLQTLNGQIDMLAPMSGTFTNRRVSVGQEVSAGEVVGEIVDSGRLRVAASLFAPPGMELQGREATLRLREDRTLSGEVRQVLPQASSTGALTVWIEGPQIDAQLRPGQTVGGEIVVESRPESLALPASAIVYDSREQPLVFVAGKDGAYEPLGIRVGLEQDGWVEVLSGLQQDHVVVTRGAYELFYRKFNQQFKVQD